MTDTKLTKNDDSTVTIEGEIAAEHLEKHRPAALKKLGEEVSIDGFRKGHVPEDMLMKHIGEYALLEEMANRALSEHYPSLLIEHKIDAIGRPDVSVTKLAAGNPLGFKITTAVTPQITLGDYKAIAKEVGAKNPIVDVTIEDAEVETFITNLLKQRATASAQASTVTSAAEVKEGEAEATLELTDDVAKSFGQFENAADMRTKIKEGMSLDKKREAQEKRRLAVLEALVEKTPFPLPAIVVDAELGKLMMQFKMDLERMGVTPADYFKRLGKNEEELAKDMRPDAEKRARIQLILNEVALSEQIFPSKEEIEKEVERIFENHEPHDGHNEVDERERATIYITTVLTNEKVLRFLEDSSSEA